MAIKWTKDDVIKRVQAAMTPEQTATGKAPNVLQGLLDRAKMKIKSPVEGEPEL